MRNSCVKKRKLNNKGISLVEILVALAIGGIVLSAISILVIQGVTNYRKQSVLAQLQNDANIAMNKISDKIMEAELVEISFYEDKNATQYIKLSENVYFIYDDESKVLYLSKSFRPDDERKSVLCQNVTDFRVRIKESSLVTEDDIVKDINKNIQLCVDIKVEKLKEERAVYRVITLRNHMDADNVKVGSDSEESLLKNKDINSIGKYIDRTK